MSRLGMKNSNVSPGELLLLFLLELLTLVTIVVCLVRHRGIITASCVLCIFLLLLPLGLERLGMRFHPVMRITIYVFIFVSIVAGSVWNLYYRVPWLDLVTHGAAGFLFAALGYSLFALLHPGKEEPSRLYLLVMAVSFSLAISLVWELFEYAMLVLADMDMQHDALLTKVATSYFSDKGGVIDVLHVTSSTFTGDFGTITVDGFLDMGYMDTLGDMLIETIGGAVFAVLALFRKGALIRPFTMHRD